MLSSCLLSQFAYVILCKFKEGATPEFRTVGQPKLKREIGRGKWVRSVTWAPEPKIEAVFEPTHWRTHSDTYKIEVAIVEKFATSLGPVGDRLSRSRCWLLVVALYWRIVNVYARR